MARNKYPEITEARILDAATKLFLQKGWEDTTIQDIIDDLGDVTRGAFYHHFKSKDDIIDAVTTRIFMGNNPFEQVKAKPELNGLEKMKYVLKQSVCRNDTLDLSKTAGSVLRSPICIGKQTLDTIGTMAVYFTEYMEEGVKDGSIHTAHPRQAAETLLLLLNIWFSPLIFTVSREEYRDKFQHLKSMYDNLGVPVFDDELQTMLEKLYDNFANQN